MVVFPTWCHSHQPKTNLNSIHNSKSSFVSIVFPFLMVTAFLKPWTLNTHTKFAVHMCMGGLVRDQAMRTQWTDTRKVEANTISYLQPATENVLMRLHAHSSVVTTLPWGLADTSDTATFCQRAVEFEDKFKRNCSLIPKARQKLLLVLLQEFKVWTQLLSSSTVCNSL